MQNILRVLLVLLFGWLFYEGVSGLVGDSGGISQRRIGLAIGAIALGVGFIVIRQKGHDKRREKRRRQTSSPPTRLLRFRSKK